ncbi:Deoxyribodipyrimidine photolyase [Hoeflea phototrophica DFL-43]|jgi:deoxyribodipyrimidine photo-lyase|uniref:Deoxyribodipyrimidine photo-lyase n=1 Tax=Hoeflea phototrophica (strain DSM 17068 / NCIMB 14078 / DFL-43) TaxID=411684 RepID=A9D5S2_HOEPD|nr:deoxyribodipyrimidine photo-lyase [Hoeflea phototrophica]EDQ33352.1 Deoxyribodipyrimidine photolyase [Hoeflea phototrophica DFL-43]
MTPDNFINDRPAIVWFRNDLRVNDNAALLAASSHKQVVPVYILEPAANTRAIGGARKWWLHHSLAKLGEKLADLGAPLMLMRGDPALLIAGLVEKTDAAAVYWNRRYDPAFLSSDASLKDALRAQDIVVESFAGQLLHEPTRVRTGNDTFYKVYSPFWRAIEGGIEDREPAPAPDRLTALANAPQSETLSDWGLLPTKPDWARGLRETWKPGEDGAHERLDEFVSERVCGYASLRDVPGVESTSRLSPHLANGEITPAQIIQALKASDADASPKDRTVFRKEVGWREFSYHLLVNEPDLPQQNHNSRFDGFPWKDDETALLAWQKGVTGYPIVDAGMRELWRTGWMHNRVRMVTASFLTKHLMVDWREGERWFWDTLVDADPASNAASWQWVAGSGADAAPYFRVFNPIIQGEKFDPDGDYVRRYVPELANLPSKFIHKPWTAPDDALAKAGVHLGETYPMPIVDHQQARNRALAAYEKIKDAA